MQIGSSLPNDETDDSIEGVLAHEMAATLLRGLPIAHTDDVDMFEAATLYANTIRALIAKQVGTYEVHIEERVEGVAADNWGTPDAWVFNRAKMILDVFDFKYGHDYVEVYKNFQLLNYTIGILKKLGIITAPTTINLHIIQPRSYHRDGPVRTWSLTLAELSRFEAMLTAAAIESTTTNATVTTGDECKHCLARTMCPVLLASTYSIIDIAGKSLPMNIPPQAVGKILAQVRAGLKRLEAIETGLTQQVEMIIRGGGRVSGFNLTSSAGRTKWTASDAEVIALGDMMGVALGKTSVITPTQAIAAGLDAAMVAGMSKSSSGAPTLTADGVKLSCVFGVK